jgi:hypothetical protein
VNFSAYSLFKGNSFSQVTQSSIRKPVVQKDRSLTRQPLPHDPQIPCVRRFILSFLLVDRELADFGEFVDGDPNSMKGVILH